MIATANSQNQHRARTIKDSFTYLPLIAGCAHRGRTGGLSGSRPRSNRPTAAWSTFRDLVAFLGTTTRSGSIIPSRIGWSIAWWWRLSRRSSFFFSIRWQGTPSRRKRFRGKDMLFILLLSTLMIPLAVTLLPTFLLANSLNLVDSYQALILPALAYPVGVS